MLVIVGSAGSGKTTVLKALEKKGYRRIVTYTTRPPRNNEIDGIDYNFITNEKFCQLAQKGFFAETSEYLSSFGICRYGSARYSFENSEGMIALDVNGVKSLKGNKNIMTLNAFVVYLHVTEKLLEQRLYSRGDSKAEIAQRMRHDRDTLHDIKKYSDLVIHIDEEITVEDIVDKIEKCSSRWKIG